MSYLRRASLIVAGQDDALELGDLRLKFTIRQSDISTPNTATIRVYNVSPYTSNVIENEYSRVILQCGYEDTALGTRFDGALVQVRRGRENAADTYLDLLCTDGIQAYALAAVSTSLAAGSSMQQRLDVLTAALKSQGALDPAVHGDLSDVSLPRGKVLYGKAADQLDQLATNADARFSMQSNAPTVIADNAYVDGPIVKVSAETGMIGIPEQTQGGIRVKVLINPEIKIGGRIQIGGDINQQQIGVSKDSLTQNATIPQLNRDGFYRVCVMDDEGDTRGQEWYSDLTCLAVDNTITPQSIINRGLT